MTAREPAPPRTRAREAAAWAALAGAALVVRLLFSGCRLVLSGDEMHYAESLWRFMHGRFIEGVSDYWSFFYPLCAWPLGAAAGDAERGLRLLSMLAGAALVIPVALLARRLWGRRVAIFAAVLVALSPTLVSFSAAAAVEPLYGLLLLLALFAFTGFMRTGKLAPLSAAGALLGLAWMARQEAVFILLLCLVFVLAGKGGEGLRAPLRMRLARGACAVVFFAAAALPHVVILHEKTGEWSAGSKASVNLSSPAVWRDGLEREKYVYSLDESGARRRIEAAGSEGALRVLWREKSSIAAGYFGKLSAGANLVPMLLASPLLLLVVPLGLFGRRWKRKDRGEELLLLLVGLFPFVFYPIFRVEFRYLVPYLPVYLMWGGAGCEAASEWLRDAVPARRLVPGLALAIVFASAVPFIAHRYEGTRANERVDWKEIGDWMMRSGASSGRILAEPGCSISYYAGSPEATFIPWTDPEGLLRYARLRGYEYLALEELYVRANRPALATLLDGPLPTGVEALGRFPGPGGRVTVVYRIAPSG